MLNCKINYNLKSQSASISWGICPVWVLCETHRNKLTKQEMFVMFIMYLYTVERVGSSAEGYPNMKEENQ